MSQRTTQFIAIFAIIILGVGGLFITIGLFSLDNSGTTTTTTTTSPTTTTNTTTTDTTTTTTTTTNTTNTTTTTTEEESKTLTILTRHDISIQGVFEAAFLATPFAMENDIVDIKWRSPAPEFWDDLILEETADVCWGGGSTLFDQLLLLDLLGPLNSTKMQLVSSRVNDTIAGVDMKRNNTADELVWIASKLSSYGFTVNHAFLDTYSLPTPTTWTDLADPIWAKELPTVPTIAMGNAPDTTSNTRIYEIITQALGWEAGWVNMARMAGSAEIYGGSVETQNAAENGDVGVSMSIDFYGYLTQSRNPDCEYIVPEFQSEIEGDPIAISATSTQKDLAEGFLDFVLSAEGQALWLDDDLQRMPVMREAFDQPGLGDVSTLYHAFNQTIATVGIDFDEELSLSINRAFIKYFESVFTDAHDELVECWTAIITAFDEGRIDQAEFDDYCDMMGALISIEDPKTSVIEEFTIAYAIAINDDMIYDASYASAVQSRWTIGAMVQYLSITSMVNAEASSFLQDSLQAIITLLLSSGGFAVIVLAVPKYNQI